MKPRHRGPPTHDVMASLRKDKNEIKNEIQTQKKTLSSSFCMGKNKNMMVSFLSKKQGPKILQLYVCRNSANCMDFQLQTPKTPQKSPYKKRGIFSKEKIPILVYIYRERAQAPLAI